MLAGGAVVVAGVLPLVFAALGPQAYPWNVSIIGAIGLFAAARLGFWQAVGFLGLAIAFKDASFYFTRGWHPSAASWPLFIMYAAIGWLLLRRRSHAAAVGGAALAGSLSFFLISNFICWLDPQLGYEQSLDGLLTCYVRAIPFFRGTFAGDLLFTGGLFAADALLCSARTAAAAPVEVGPDESW